MMKHNNQKILNLFLHEKLVIHKQNELAYNLLFNDEIIDKKIVIYGDDVKNMLSYLFKEKDFYTFNDLKNYHMNKYYHIFIDLTSNTNYLDIFNFLNYILNKKIFLIIYSHQYPVQTSIKDLNSRINSFINVNISYDYELKEFQNLIQACFDAKYIIVDKDVIKYLSLRLDKKNMANKIHYICTKSLKYKKKITIFFIKALNCLI